jgi:6-phosphofructokinase 1
MKALPPVVKGQEFPKSEMTKKGVTSVVYDMTSRVLKNVETLGLDYLIAIGGDDTLSYAARLDAEGFKVLAIPKTMDNDVRNTEYCIGFSTAITRATEAIERQRTTVGSHERIGVFRIFGRDAGYTALYTAYVTSMRCCIPEHRFNLQHLIELLITDKQYNPSNYALIILSEGAEWEGYQVKELGEADAFGHKKKANVGEDLAEEIKKSTGEETIVSDLTYDLRSGSPDFVDKMVASTFASMAMDCIQQGQHGVMMAISSGCYQAVTIPDPKLGPRRVDLETMYNTRRYRPNYANKIGLPIFLPHYLCEIASLLSLKSGTSQPIILMGRNIDLSGEVPPVPVRWRRAAAHPGDQPPRAGHGAAHPGLQQGGSRALSVRVGRIAAKAPP